VRVRDAAVGSAVFFVAAPVVVAGALPWWIGHDGATLDASPLTVVLGSLLVAAGAIALLDSFVRFVRQGRGTPAPVAPTEELVVTGLYRYVRNPMYVAVFAVILGQAVLLRSPAVLLYAGIAAAAVVAFVHFYEEPTLSGRYGNQYGEYRAAVPGWVPRLTPGWPPRT
jgi:protein-S-isoprenylcysteine O-methyltransferase Ste14